MSDTPTFANLLSQLFTGSADERASVMRYLTEQPDAAHALEQVVRERLRETHTWSRIVAAEAVFRVYRDRVAAIDTLAGVLKLGDPAVSTSTLETVQALGSAATPLLQLLARHTPTVLQNASVDFLQWAGAAAISFGPDGLGVWAELLNAASAEGTRALLVGFAWGAPRAEYDLAPAEAVLRAKAAAGFLAEAGVALWRVNWRVNRDWLASLQADSTSLDVPGLRELVLRVLIEHLGRRPDLAGLVREMLAVQAEREPGAESAVKRLATLGSRGWGVLIPMLNPSRVGERCPVPHKLRVLILKEAIEHRQVLPLVHHHAHAVILDPAVSGPSDLLFEAARVLFKLKGTAGTAIPDLLNLIVRVPSVGSVLALTVGAVAPGYPNASAAIVRALHRLRTTPYFGTEQLAAFQALAEVLAELALDLAPTLIENSAIEPQVPDLLLQQTSWKEAPRDARVRHAQMLADRLASPRPEVRVRAAELLRHYRDELPEVWPALVAVLAGADEKTAMTVLPHFRYLDRVAEVVTAELLLLFREPNAAYAARAVVALWRLGRMPTVSDELRAAVERDPKKGWGWAVLQGVVDRVASAHGLLRDLNAVFAASPAAVAEKVNALVNPAESPEEQRFTACVPRPGEPGAPEHVLWDDVHVLVRDDGANGPLMFVALMCAHGSAGFRSQKIWMIKAQRDLTRTGLAEAKSIIERLIDRMPVAGATTADRQVSVREYFTGRTELPTEIVRMIEHPVSWYRWAGLELADAWGLTSAEVELLTEDRIWDRSPRVRQRAVRLRWR